jgi:Autotransporter beta-domain
MAMPRSARTPQPQASTAPWSALIIAFRRSRLLVLHWRAVAPILVLRVAAPGIPICSRPVRSCPAYISAALAYGWQDITTNRTVTAGGTNQLRAEFDANAFSGRLEGGYRFVAPWVGGIGITPYAAAQFTTFDLPGYAEQAIVGSNAFALAYGAKDITDTRSELGIRTDKSWAMTDGILTLRGRVAWAHDYDRIGRSQPPSSRCRARASSSTARPRPPTPRWSQRRSKRNGATAGRPRPPSKANSPT